jgi:hypothetical protein
VQVADDGRVEEDGREGPAEEGRRAGEGEGRHGRRDVDYAADNGSTGWTLSNDGAAYSFLVGGIGGFLYLLLLQRSVDGLPAISSPSEASSSGPL